jgi:hypothetical protein
MTGLDRKETDSPVAGIPADWHSKVANYPSNAEAQANP